MSFGKLLPLSVVALALCGGGVSQAACVGGAGSADLSCTSTQGTLSDFESWITGTYTPAAINSIMSTFAAVFSPSISGMTGWGQIYDTWGGGGKTGKTTQYSTLNVSPYFVSSSTSSSKATSAFLVDGTQVSGSGANIYIELSWTGTVAQIINGATNYIASYTYTARGDAWGAAVVNGTPQWMQNGSVRSSGSGTYVLAAVAVPGPIAGAGIPALLGLIGFSLWRRRRAA